MQQSRHCSIDALFVLQRARRPRRRPCAVATRRTQALATDAGQLRAILVDHGAAFEHVPARVGKNVGREQKWWFKGSGCMVPWLRGLCLFLFEVLWLVGLVVLWFSVCFCAVVA